MKQLTQERTAMMRTNIMGVAANILNSWTIYEAPPICWNRSSRRLLVARRLESGIGFILKYWLHKKSIVLSDNVHWNSCLSFQHCAANIVRHVYALHPISRQGAGGLGHYIVLHTYIHLFSNIAKKKNRHYAGRTARLNSTYNRPQQRNINTLM